MVKNKNNWLVFSFFSWYISRRVTKHFSRIVCDEIKSDENQAVLLIANHYSWWDGFLYFHLNKLLFKKKFHVMILEDTIKKNGFMKFTGAFSVSKGSKNIIETLQFAGQLLDDPHNLVLIFPQGKLFSNFIDEIIFEKGLGKIVNLSKKKFSYVFAASFTEHFAQARPSAFVYLKKADSANFAGLAAVQSAYRNHYLQARLQQTAIVK